LRASSAPIVVGLLLAALSVLAPARPARAVEYGTLTLTWTAPGDDSLTGTATAYDLRYFTIPINSANFFSAFKVSSVPVPLVSGKTQNITVHGLNPGTWYYFAIRTVDDAGNWSVISNVVHAQASYPVGVGEGLAELDFSNPFPNPARGAASFALSLPAAGAVDVQAYDVTGRHVRTLMDGSQPAGHQTLVWDLRDDGGRPLGAGVYLVRARLGDRTFVRRVLVGR
jgi:hypothetical protein